MYETLSISPAHLLCALLNIFLRKQDDRNVLMLVGSKSSCAACRSLQMMPTGFPFTRSRNIMPNSKLLKTRRCVQGKGCRGGVTTQHLEYTHAQDLSITRTLHFPGEYTLLKFTFSKFPQLPSSIRLRPSKPILAIYVTWVQRGPETTWPQNFRKLRHLHRAMPIESRQDA
jgi:hypothetical protein